MAKYEAVIIFDPFLPEEDYAGQVDRVKELVSKQGAEVTGVDTWGKKRLAYPIMKKIEGYYILVNFESKVDGPVIAEIERGLKLNEAVLRGMVTRVPNPPKPRKVKVKKPRAQSQNEGYQGGGNRYVEPRAAGDAGAANLGQPGAE